MRLENPHATYTYRRGCGVVETFTAYDVAAPLQQADAPAVERERAQRVLALAVGDTFEFTSERDGLAVRFTRVA